MDNIKKIKRRNRVKFRIRKRVSGTAECPRLSVFRSLSQIYAQLIDDVTGQTLVSASSFEKETRGTSKGKTKVEVSFEIGKTLAEKAVAAGVKKVVFDRNGYAYHGRVKSLADGAREGGLVF